MFETGKYSCDDEIQWEIPTQNRWKIGDTFRYELEEKYVQYALDSVDLVDSTDVDAVFSC